MRLYRIKNPTAFDSAPEVAILGDLPEAPLELRESNASKRAKITLRVSCRALAGRCWLHTSRIRVSAIAASRATMILLGPSPGGYSLAPSCRRFKTGLPASARPLLAALVFKSAGGGS